MGQQKQVKFILCLVGLVAVDAITIQPMPKDAVELKVGATTTLKHSDGDHDHSDSDHDHSDSDHDHDQTTDLMLGTSLANKDHDHSDSDHDHSDSDSDSDHHEDHDHDHSETGEKIKIALAIFERMESKGVHELNKKQLIAGGKKYLKDNKMNVPKEKFMKIIDQIWKIVNKNGDDKITCLELGQAVFGVIDQNGDGTL